MKKKSSILPWLIWGIAAGFYFAQYLARVAPSVMGPQLMQAFSINAFALGSLSACFYYSYVAMQIPVGMLMDRFGVRRLLIMALLLMSFGCAMFTYAPDIYVADLGRFLIGFAGAFSFVGAIKLVSNWFDASRFGMLIGTTQALGMFGAVMGSVPIAIALPYFGWRNTILLIVGLFLILFLSAIFIVRDRPARSKSSSLSEPVIKKVTLWESLRIVLKNPQTWLNALYIGAIFAPVAAFSEFWGRAIYRAGLSFPCCFSCNCKQLGFYWLGSKFSFDGLLK